MSQFILPRSTPELQGVESKAVLAFLKASNRTIHEMHSFMLLRHGQVITECWWKPYAPDLPHSLWSLSKSFTSTAIGMLIDEGRLKLNDKVISFFPDELPSKVGENLAKMTTHDLLCMACGHDKDNLEALRDLKDDNWVKAFLAWPVEHIPGTHFVYNSGATYMLSAILQKVTGVKLIDYLTARLFQPLGIDNPTWDSCPRGINTGGWGLAIKTEDIARFGQLYLQKGMWLGKRLVPAEWVEKATSRQVDNSSNTDVDWQQGYGYQFWRSQHGAYRGDGAFGQFCVVLPDQDAVIAITAGVENMQNVLNLVWEYLLPAFRSEVVADKPVEFQGLQRFITGLQHKPPASKAEHRQVKAAYRFKANMNTPAKILLEFNADACIIHYTSEQQEKTLVCGIGYWAAGVSNFMLPDSVSVVASAAWSDENTLKIIQRVIETPSVLTTTFKFRNDQVKTRSVWNVSFGPKGTPWFTGDLIH
jgi:hypothetical protein